ncbi:hypothetical protein GGI03_002527 [Coemansia sp. RSA 2337]|nr:hypothetical protein LPJ71_005946 [Coemansia sp. S17]KAJ2020820.1 hypothetical protein GGI14_000522 [Coemansia sp. S680]KAJ2041170.1 hypothetical protein H4S03_000553 [Coemansia sp. S3946]KAJ2042579.1 hypothetical protein H4S04_007221 [Coemansia sp. S16]KAJ2098510.1 hypothetical protein GGI09_003279 [Coemansia sp. S100]KAJ2114518.1 hypothetical protein IW146_003034 [Coemansia sp. RSA 922]KAJ2335257.1 hypothetical protein GGH92_008079 [Coemansia sp. RSA 2673]KAJ2465687.1 hypothetical prote
MGPVKKTGKTGKGGKATSPYSAFFQRELKKIKLENPSIAHKDAFKQAGLNWRTSPENPKNQSKGAEADASTSKVAPVEPSAEKQVEKPVEVAPAMQPSQADLAPPPPVVAPAAAPAPEHAPSVSSVPVSNGPAFSIPATSDAPKPSGAPSAFGKGGIPEESGSSIEARAASPANVTAAGAAHQPPTSSKPPASRVLTPVIPSMATHTVPGALTAAK